MRVGRRVGCHQFQKSLKNLLKMRQTWWSVAPQLLVVVKLRTTPQTFKVVIVLVKKPKLFGNLEKLKALNKSFIFKKY